jgi:RNA polymerase sigma-70 factor (ECF subfamily)
MASEQSQSSTRVSLILRAQNREDQVAWNEFVHRYGPVVIRWCRRWCKQDADVEDLSQNILFRVWEKLPGLNYSAGGTFRGWLRRVSHNAFIDVWRRDSKWKRLLPIVGDELDPLATDLSEHMQQQFDKELFELACTEVRLVLNDDQWCIFQQTELEQTNAREVAERFGKSLAAVRMNNLRIRKQLRMRVAQMEATFDSIGS